MTKKGVRVVVSGAQRRMIDVETMTQIIIALGRELAERATTENATVNVIVESKP